MQLNKDRKEGKDGDVIIELNSGVKMRAHMRILLKFTPYLRSLFKTSYTRGYSGLYTHGNLYKVKSKGLTKEVVEAFLTCLYTGEFNVNSGNDRDPLVNATHFEHDETKQKIDLYIKDRLTIGNVIQSHPNNLIDSFNFLYFNICKSFLRINFPLLRLTDATHFEHDETKQKFVSYTRDR